MKVSKASAGLRRQQKPGGESSCAFSPTQSLRQAGRQAAPPCSLYATMLGGCVGVLAQPHAPSAHSLLLPQSVRACLCCLSKPVGSSAAPPPLLAVLGSCGGKNKWSAALTLLVHRAKSYLKSNCGAIGLFVPGVGIHTPLLI